MTLQVKYNKLENDCFNLLIVDPNPPHDLKYFSLFLRLENTAISTENHYTICIVAFLQGRLIKRRNSSKLASTVLGSHAMPMSSSPRKCTSVSTRYGFFEAMDQNKFIAVDVNQRLKTTFCFHQELHFLNITPRIQRKRNINVRHVTQPRASLAQSQAKSNVAQQTH